MTPMTPGAALARRLYETQVRIYVLAKAIGVTRKTISAILHDRQRITPALGAAIAVALGEPRDTYIRLQLEADLEQLDARALARVPRLTEAA